MNAHDDLIALRAAVRGADNTAQARIRRAAIIALAASNHPAADVCQRILDTTDRGHTNSLGDALWLAGRVRSLHISDDKEHHALGVALKALTTGKPHTNWTVHPDVAALAVREAGWEPFLAALAAEHGISDLDWRFAVELIRAGVLHTDALHAAATTTTTEAAR